MTEQLRHFAVCIRNDDHEESLDLRKIYEVLDDSVATKHGMVRILDEEGDDYLYPSHWFLAIDLPHNVEDAIVELTHS